METFSIQSDCRVRCAVHAYVLFLGGPKSRREINVRARKACLMSVSPREMVYGVRTAQLAILFLLDFIVI